VTDADGNLITALYHCRPLLPWRRWRSWRRWRPWRRWRCFICDVITVWLVSIACARTDEVFLYFASVVNSVCLSVCLIVRVYNMFTVNERSHSVCVECADSQRHNDLILLYAYSCVRFNL